IAWLLAGLVAALICRANGSDFGVGFSVTAGCILVLATAGDKWLVRRTTEIAVTDRRVIYKTGLIRRHTTEMNMDKVESVLVDQSVIGRLLNYGTIHVRGTGVGIENLHYISSPISFRNTVLAK